MAEKENLFLFFFSSLRLCSFATLREIIYPPIKGLTVTFQAIAAKLNKALPFHAFDHFH
ncbi:MAG: hypothetical protein WCO29_12170 [Nostocales cyanobacterium ELA583]|jgi:hypothetical protein